VINQWIHIALTVKRASSTILFYEDGIILANDNQITPLPPNSFNSNGDFIFGAVPAVFTGFVG